MLIRARPAVAFPAPGCSGARRQLPPGMSRPPYPFRSASPGRRRAAAAPANGGRALMNTAGPEGPPAAGRARPWLRRLLLDLAVGGELNGPVPGEIVLGQGVDVADRRAVRVNLRDARRDELQRRHA